VPDNWTPDPEDNETVEEVKRKVGGHTCTQQGISLQIHYSEMDCMCTSLGHWQHERQVAGC